MAVIHVIKSALSVGNVEPLFNVIVDVAKLVSITGKVCIVVSVWSVYTVDPKAVPLLPVIGTNILKYDE